MPRSTKGLTVGLLLCITASAFEAQAVLTAMPAAASDLGQLDLYAWAFTAFVIPQVVAIVVAGRLCDSIGPVGPFLTGTGVFGTGVVVSALAPTMPVLLLGRFVQGAGAGTINLALMVLLGVAYAPEVRARLITWFSAAWMLPSFLGPAIAAWLVERLSWHWVFWGVLPLVVCGALVMMPRLRGLDLRRKPHEASPRTTVASVATALGVCGLQAAGQGLGPATLPVALASVVVVALGLRPLLPEGRLALTRGLTSVVATRALVAGSFFAAEAFVPLVMTRVLGLPLIEAGFAITIGSVGWMAGSWLQSQRWMTLRRDVLTGLGCWLVAAGVGGAAAVVGTHAPSWALIAALAVAGLGMGLAIASQALAIIHLSPEGELGANTSSLQVGEVVGTASLTGLAGTLFARLGNEWPLPQVFTTLFAVLAGFGVLAGLVAARIGPVANVSAGEEAARRAAAPAEERGAAEPG